MGIPAGRGPSSPPKLSPNKCGRGVVAVMSHVGTTTSALSNPHVGLGYYPEGNQGNPQSPLTQPLLFIRHPPPRNSGRPLSSCGPWNLFWRVTNSWINQNSARRPCSFGPSLYLTSVCRSHPGSNLSYDFLRSKKTIKRGLGTHFPNHKQV